MGEMLNDLIKTSKSGHTYTGDMNMLFAALQDNIDRWGIELIEHSIEGYLRGSKRVTTALAKVEKDSDTLEINL